MAIIKASGIPVYCSHSKIVPIGKLKGNPKNPNTHPESQIELLSKIIQGQGWRNPVVVSKRSGLIVKGHARLSAAKILKVKEIPVDYQAYDSDEAEIADMIADNRIAELAEMDMDLTKGLLLDLKMTGIDMDLTGYGLESLNEIIIPGKADDGKIDDVPEPPKIPTTKLGDLYQLGKHRLLCGDSTKEKDVSRLMDGQKADMVFTDPPYGLGGYGGRKNMNLEGDDKDPSVFYSIIPVAREIYVWGYFWTFPMLNFKPKDAIVWAKNNFGLGRGYRGQYEICFYSGEFSGSDSDLWEIDRDTKYEHPTQKPVALIERAIKNSLPKNVLDLFGGSGSTLIGCEQHSIPCLVMEIDPIYCDVIIKRWEDFTNKKAKRLK